VRTTGDATQLRMRAMRVSVAAVAACGAFALTGLALGAASFSDTADDNNMAPDITSVQVSAAADGLVTVVLGVRNFQTLPEESWFNLWFDLDSNQSTGDGGDEKLVRYLSTGEVALYEWDGLLMVERPAPGVTGRFEAGVLTVTIPSADLGGDSSFGVLAVSSRSQEFLLPLAPGGRAEFIASDFAPDRGRSAYSGPAQATFPDPGNDEDAAPDLTDLRVTDAKNGWIRFAVSTPNYAMLPDEAVLQLLIDSDDRVGNRDADADAELQISFVDGEAVLERWDRDANDWAPDEAPTRVRARNSGNVATIEIHRSELGNAPRMGFSLTSAAVDVEGQAVLAVDIAPAAVGDFFRYTFANKLALNLVATRLSATPSRPRAGKPFVVNLAVRRSDTNRAIASGNASCKSTLDGKPLRGKGSVARGAGHCSFAIPSSAAGSRLRGTITVRVDGKSVTAGFAYVVR
jgi:hypothetical protein